MKKTIGTNFGEIYQQKINVWKDLQQLKQIIILRSDSGRTNKEELRIFLEKIEKLIRGINELSVEKNWITEIIKQMKKSARYSRIVEDTVNTIKVIQQKIESIGLEAAQIFAIKEDRLDKITSLLRLDHLTPEVKKQVDEYLEDGVVKPSLSPYSNPVFIVPKKPDSQGNPRYRIVLDFRKLNEVTVGDSYPLPNISDILDQLGGAQYFTTLDLFWGYHQVELDERDAYKTAFSTPEGHFEFTRLPFGLSNSPRTFQRLMYIVLSGLHGTVCYVYLDDVVIYAKNLKEHAEKFDLVMNRLREANMKLQVDKCEFLRREVVYLGHVITQEGVKPCPDKVNAVQEFSVPKTVRNMQHF